MAKFPDPPGAAALARLAPATLQWPAGSTLARVYFAGSEHALQWNQFRYFGPTNARWDHHLHAENGDGQMQSRGVYYAAEDAKTCFAEVFQATRRIDRVFRSPRLVIFQTQRRLRLLDLRGDFTTRMGASMAIHTGNKIRARAWARDLYEAFDLQGILYSSSMNGGAGALALNERAADGLFAPHPLLHRALADDAMVDVLKNAADLLGYALR